VKQKPKRNSHRPNPQSPTVETHKRGGGVESFEGGKKTGKFEGTGELVHRGPGRFWVRGGGVWRRGKGDEKLSMGGREGMWVDGGRGGGPVSKKGEGGGGEGGVGGGRGGGELVAEIMGGGGGKKKRRRVFGGEERKGDSKKKRKKGWGLGGGGGKNERTNRNLGVTVIKGMGE